MSYTQKVGLYYKLCNYVNRNVQYSHGKCVLGRVDQLAQIDRSVMKDDIIQCTWDETYGRSPNHVPDGPLDDRVPLDFSDSNVSPDAEAPFHSKIRREYYLQSRA